MSYLNPVQHKSKSGNIVLLLKPDLVFISCDLIQKLRFPLKSCELTQKNGTDQLQMLEAAARVTGEGATKDPC